MNEFNEAVSKYSRIDSRFLVLWENDQKLPLIETGIIFILATWSAPTLVQFSLLTETLSKLDLDKLKIYVIDTDELNQADLEKQGISIPHGWGETYWIKNYKIEHFLNAKENDVSKIVLYTNELFSQKLTD